MLAPGLVSTSVGVVVNKCLQDQSLIASTDWPDEQVLDR